MLVKLNIIFACFKLFLDKQIRILYCQLLNYGVTVKSFGIITQIQSYVRKLIVNLNPLCLRTVSCNDKTWNINYAISFYYSFLVDFEILQLLQLFWGQFLLVSSNVQCCDVEIIRRQFEGVLKVLQVTMNLLFSILNILNDLFETFHHIIFEFFRSQFKILSENPDVDWSFLHVMVIKISQQKILLQILYKNLFIFNFHQFIIKNYQFKMSKSNRQSGLGKALKNKLQKSKATKIGDRAPIFYQQTEGNEAQIKKGKLKSVVTQNSLEGFLQIAELSEQDFHANRNIKFKQIREQMRNKKIITVKDKKHFLVEELVDQKLLQQLQLPRRPNWKNLDKEQLEKKQNEAYLNWRRTLAMIEQKNTELQITPFEKNIEVWKQLWRVLDRAQLIIQIVDGRDPLFFRSEDLEQYIKELNPNKESLLLVNKSDLLTPKKIIIWNQYLTKNGINHIFFSAIEQIKVNEAVVDDQHSETTQQQSNNNQSIHKFVNSADILSVLNLIQLFQLYAKQLKLQKIQIGLVGYPNVGKSSVINAVFGKKRVAVASMPGKTKHFQTLPLTERVILCDCPGLVFPRISSSEAEMILNGLYSIDTLKNFQEAIEIVSLRIPRKQIEDLYSLHWKQNEIYDGQKIVEKYAMLKGFYTGSGLPNKSIAARYILKDYVKGVLKYAKHPPGYKLEQQMLQNQFQLQFFEQKSEKQQSLTEINVKKKQLQIEKELDGEFFTKEQAIHEQGYEQAVKQLTEDDLLDIIQGKKVPNILITKQMRKQIKFALKRGDKLEQVKKKIFLVSTTVKDKHKTMIKV